MSYRGPDKTRQRLQVADIFQHGGYTATWRQYVSASAGNQDAGLGDRYYYREQTITALMGLGNKRPAPERQTPIGMLTSDTVITTTREKLGRRDELVWRGNTYRIESDSVPSTIGPHWVTEIKRGE